MTGRDQLRERRFLAEAGAGHQAFITQALARLDAGQVEYGDSWAWIGVRRHFVELTEECADLGAWAVLADQAADRDAGLSYDQREHLRQTLRRVASLGAAAHRLLTDAAADLEVQR